MEQRTEEWFAARLGKLTASKAAAAFDVSKRDGSPLKASIDMAYEVATERVTGAPVEHVTNAYMQWGTEHEDDARSAYECETGEIVEQVGLIDHPTIKGFAASPDGLVGTDGLIEIKCPASITHMRRVCAGLVPEEYKYQMLCQLACTRRKWVDYVDYDPRFPKKPLFIVRYEPDEEEIANVEEKAKAFLDRVDALVDQFNK